MREGDTGPVMTTPSVTLGRVDPEHVEIDTWEDDGRTVASLRLGPVTLHDDLTRLAAVAHRADVLCQARLQVPGAPSPHLGAYRKATT